MRRSNKAVGNAFERALAQMLFNKGYWVHLLTQSRAGQPADIIAAKNGKTYLIDCKNCERDVFDLSRIEDNQRTAMEMWYSRGNGIGWFAINTKSGIRMIPYDALLTVEKQLSVLSEKQIVQVGIPFGEWVKP